MITAKLKKRPTLKAVVTKPYQGKGYAEGYEDGLEKGYANGEADANAAAEAANAVILANCNAVLPQKGVETAETLEQVPQRIGEIQVTEDMLRYCNQPNFPGLGVFDKEDVVLDFDIAYSCYRMIYASWDEDKYPNTKVKHLVVNFAQKQKSAQQAFYGVNMGFDYILERITFNADISQSTASATNMFSHWQALKVVDGTPFDLSSTTTIGTMFNYCNALEEIRFAPNSIKVSINLSTSAVLSNATIQSIIDGLAEVATAHTLTLHAAVGAKLTEAQKAAITAKNWTLVY